MWDLRLILIRQRQEVRPNGFIERIPFFAIFFNLHKVKGGWPNASAHPLFHLWRPHRGDLAVGHFLNDLLYLNHFGLGVLDRRLGQRLVQQHAAVVDALVDMIVRQLLGGQRAQHLADRAHGPYVLLAILDHLLQ